MREKRTEEDQPRIMERLARRLQVRARIESTEGMLFVRSEEEMHDPAAATAEHG